MKINFSDKLKNFIKNNSKLYIIARCIKNINDPNLFKLLNGYYEESSSYLPIMIMNYKNPSDLNNLIYMIQYGCNDICTMGFGALLRSTLCQIKFAEIIKCQPLVIWGKGTHYYDGSYQQSENAFTYYFKPISPDFAFNDNDQYILADKLHTNSIHKTENYKICENDVNYYANLYKKYIVLNNETENYIKEQMKKIFMKNKILGIHIRGTDFNMGFKGHPKVVTSKMCIEKVKEVFGSGKYDKIFIATEDINLLDSFKEVFGNNLVYYDDVFRTSGKTGPHSTQNDRPLHHYKLGLEVLRDMYTLAYCDSLICGMSQVSFAARYINKALGKNYEEFVLIDNGVNKSGKIIKPFYNIKGKP